MRIYLQVKKNISENITDHTPEYTYTVRQAQVNIKVWSHPLQSSDHKLSVDWDTSFDFIETCQSVATDSHGKTR